MIKIDNKSVRDHLNNFLNEAYKNQDKNECDLVIVTDTKQIYCHSQRLRASSKILRDLLESPLSQTKKIIMMNFRYDHIKYLIDYLYTGTIHVPRSDYVQVVECGLVMGIEGFRALQEAVTKKLQNKRSVESPVVRNSSTVSLNGDSEGSHSKRVKTDDDDLKDFKALEKLAAEQEELKKKKEEEEKKGKEEEEKRKSAEEEKKKREDVRKKKAEEEEREKRRKEKEESNRREKDEEEKRKEEERKKKEASSRESSSGVTTNTFLKSLEEASKVPLISLEDPIVAKGSNSEGLTKCTHCEKEVYASKHIKLPKELPETCPIDGCSRPLKKFRRAQIDHLKKAHKVETCDAP